MPDPIATPADQVAAAAAATAPVEGAAPAAAAAVADAAKQTAESQASEDETLLGNKEGEEGKEGKEAAAVAEAPKPIPEKYEVKVPEGMTIDQGLVDKLTPIFKESKLSNEQVQKLTDAYAPYMKSAMEAQQQESINGFKEIVNGWKDQTIKDLGPDFAKQLAPAAKLMDKFEAETKTPGLREMMNETGVGNHPVLNKFLIWVGKMFDQDNYPDSGRKGSNDPRDAARKLFPTMTQ